MSALKLDPASGDLDLTGGRLNLVTGPEEIAQKLRVRYRFFRGEFFADERVGIPYFDKIFIKNPSFSAIQAIYREATITCPGIVAVEEFTMVFDPPTRKLTIQQIRARLQSGEVLDFSDDFILEVA
jgi:hypothetical protein